jgi:hypothetical protein
MLAAAAVLLITPALAHAEDAISHPAKKPIGPTSLTQNDMVASLAVLNAKGASLDGNTLPLTGVAPNTIVSADRPVHAAGHVLTAHFIREWDEGAESFAKSPPNATISVLSKEGDTVDDAVVVLKSPKLDSDNLSFDVSVFEGDLNDAASAQASRPAVGAAAARPYPYYGAPPCGYYPYPPCPAY